MSPFIVGAMFTPSYQALAQRLRASCEALGLPHALVEVPAVHSSISHRGSDDPAASKPSFICALLDRYRRPVLYVDADCVFRERPQLIERLIADGHDFAIYNWLAEEYTDAFQPVPVEVDGKTSRERYFAFTHGMDHYDPAQLMCSGLVQLYADTPAARALLARWQQTIVELPGCADDHCLDAVFNNESFPALRPAWLPKEYARYAWWIYARPVIDHPDFPSPALHFRPIPETAGRRRFYPERAQKREVRLLPRDCIIDAQHGRLLRPTGESLAYVGQAAVPLWPASASGS